MLSEGETETETEQGRSRSLVQLCHEKLFKRLKRSRQCELFWQVFRNLTLTAKVQSLLATDRDAETAAAPAHVGMKGLKCSLW